MLICKFQHDMVNLFISYKKYLFQVGFNLLIRIDKHAAVSMDKHVIQLECFRMLQSI